MTDDDSRDGVYRRTVLKTTAMLGGLSAAAQFSEPAAAATEYVVEQGGNSWRVTPLDYRDQTVEEFYGYNDGDSSSSNTPTNLERNGVSNLFLYSGPKGLSLVAIHDAPGNDNGGEVTFDISGLPTGSGSWVVEDDSGEATGSTPNWSWVTCCTDGGAFRGGLDGSFSLTIDPSFTGITDWDFLSGDAGSPERIPLEMGSPVTIKTNDLPTADAGGSYTVLEGESVELDGTGSSDPDGSLVAHRWDLNGNGRTDIDDPTPVFDAAGIDGLATRTVTLTVEDDEGGTATDTATVEVQNAAPSVTIDSFPASADEGSAVTLDASYTDARGVDSHEATVDWGDGTSEAVRVDQQNDALSATHTYDDNGNYTATVTVADDDGASGSASDTIDVGNVPPSVDITEITGSIDEGDEASVTAEFGDPGTDDTHTATVDWGDDTVESVPVDRDDSLSATHVYADDGTYTVTVTVADDDGGTNSASDAVAVGNVAPSVTITDLKGSIDEGTEASVTAAFSDPGTADTHSATVDWGDGTAGSLDVDQDDDTASGSHTYADDGTYTVTVTVADDDGDSSEDTASVTVSNVAPSVTITDPPGTVDQGDGVSVAASFTDPGTADTHSATVDWGDGTVESVELDQSNRSLSATHAYAENGSYPVTVSVTDDDGATGTATARANSGIPGLGIDASPAGSERVDLTVPTGRELSRLVVGVTDGTGEVVAVLDGADFDYDGSYATTLAVEGDGRYTATVRRAVSTGGVRGGTPSDVARLETGAPGPSLSLSQSGTDRAVRVRVTADEPLASTAVSVVDADGSEVTTLTTEDLGTGETLEATTPVPGEGQYVARLVWAEDRAGNDGADGQRDAATVDVTTPEVDFWLSSPDAEELTATVRADEPLADLEVRIFAPGDEGEPRVDAVLPAFDRHREDGHVFYTLHRDPATPGTYDGRLVAAADAAGNAVVAEQTDTATVSEAETDAEPPTISEFSAATTGEGGVTVTLAADEPLAAIRVDAVAADGGERLASMDGSAFDEVSGGDGYRYRATRPLDHDGDVRLVLGTAADAAGNDAANGQSTTVSLSEEDPVERADEDDDGDVDDDELDAAIADWARGEYTTEELEAIIRAWASSS